HDALECRECLDRFALALAKARLAFLLEDEWDVDPGPPLDFAVAVVEGQMQRACEMAPDGGLARAHGADEKHAALADHLSRQDTQNECGRPKAAALSSLMTRRLSYRRSRPRARSSA